MFKILENTGTKFVFFILGAIFLINAIIATLTSDTGLGVICTYVTGILFLLSASNEKFLNTKTLHIAKICLFTILILLLAGGTVLYVLGAADNTDFEEDAVIVLGTTVKGDQPTKSLQSRLDAAIEYHQKNPQASIIVTGGQGTDENDTEASVMASYLEKAGIPKDLIIKEDKATSTVENFELSKSYLNEGDRVCFISNDFHIYRAGVLAKEAGIDDATHYSAETPLFMTIPNAFRESIVVLKMWFID